MSRGWEERFGDWGVNDDIISAQNQAFRAWMGEMPTDAKLVVVEVGAGKAPFSV